MKKTIKHILIASLLFIPGFIFAEHCHTVKHDGCNGGSPCDSMPVKMGD